MADPGHSSLNDILGPTLSPSSTMSREQSLEIADCNVVDEVAHAGGTSDLSHIPPNPEHSQNSATTSTDPTYRSPSPHLPSSQTTPRRVRFIDDIRGAYQPESKIEQGDSRPTHPNPKPRTLQLNATRPGHPPSINPDSNWVPQISPSVDTANVILSELDTDYESKAKSPAQLANEDQAFKPTLKRKLSDLDPDSESEYDTTTPEYKQPWLTAQRKRAKRTQEHHHGTRAMTATPDPSTMMTRELVDLLPRRLSSLKDKVAELNRKWNKRVLRDRMLREEIRRKAEIRRGKMTE
ncbi:hypothetical protein CONLIGDRAFT_686889 [Coniochaeta ligniaria NRRL 30616]|uniref:Uncharacterized protein n=1 Tax=Coniochaeta ligniaria NRRL 30616 TaxID=1408157 RepID=A0A1J7I654_9PEZI|nr:hypothetical protein CONLIGDRAFT_686889 [Coniochaeta ligniaria NRRL 30616]